MIRLAKTRADFALCAQINNAVNPDNPVTAEQLETAKGEVLVCEVGYAYVDRSSIPENAFAAVRVRSESRGRGVGSSLLAAAHESARRLGCTAMWGRIREGDEESLRFASNRGFEEVNRDFELVLEVSPGEREAVEALVRREMGAAVAMDVPLDVSVGVGRSWHDAAH
jgi:L-amino acid N-acyltransferase YncA